MRALNGSAPTTRSPAPARICSWLWVTSNREGHALPPIAEKLGPHPTREVAAPSHSSRSWQRPQPGVTSSGVSVEKLERLRATVRDMGSVLVAYSGGLDSAFVLAVAHEVLGERCVALTAVSPSLPARERDDALRIAQQLGARHELVQSNEIHNPDYAANPSNRCFHCKSELYTITARRAGELAIAHVVNGTNLDDLGD